MSDVTRILSQIENGDGQSAEKLLPLVYAELRKLAAAKMAQENPGQTLSGGLACPFGCLMHRNISGEKSGLPSRSGCNRLGFSIDGELAWVNVSGIWRQAIERAAAIAWVGVALERDRLLVLHAARHRSQSTVAK